MATAGTLQATSHQQPGGAHFFYTVHSFTWTALVGGSLVALGWTADKVWRGG